MNEKVLVAYGSKHGSTVEIAEAIGEAMVEAGLDVEVLPVGKVGDVEAYGAVVLGSAVYAGMWQKDAVRFLEDNEAAMAGRPVWFFSSGPTGKGDPVELLSGWVFPEAQQEVADRVGPRETVVFHGNIDLDRLGLGEKLIVKAVRGQVGDYRDWDSIRAWARGVAQVLLDT
jgi:menaquinone-dependent protoporphyrinogen oxidase